MLLNLRTKVWSKSKMEVNVLSSRVKTAKIWKQPKCPLTDGWIKKMQYIYDRILLSHKKRNKIPCHL